jgi:asparagine synthase (glutamine-hydrolysing)
MDNHITDLTNSISQAVSRSIEGANIIGIPFSGGLDSSLIAHLVKIDKEDLKITLYTVGTPDSHDLLNAEEASRALDLKWKKIEIKSEDITKAIPKLAKIIGTNHPVIISFELPLYFALANMKEELILSGQGADELFGGYARYLKMENEDLKEVMENDVKELMENGIKMELKLARHFEKILKIPYLDEEVVRVAKMIPIEKKVGKGQRKIILREAALHLGLPEKIANTEKKAVQYSSGIIKELRRISKKEGMGVNELIESLLKNKNK